MRLARFTLAALPASFLLLPAAGCAGAPAPPTTTPASFWEARATSVGIAVVAPPVAAHYVLGPADSVARANASTATAALNRYLATLTPLGFDSLPRVFAARLGEGGFQSIALPAPVDWGLYSALRLGAKGTGEGLRALRSTFGIDYLLLLAVDRFGTFRDYFVFGPTAAPLGMFQVSGLLLDLRSDRVLWQVAMLERQNLVVIEGPWEQPPTYPNVTRAIQNSEREAATWLQSSFFPMAPGTGASSP